MGLLILIFTLFFALTPIHAIQAVNNYPRSPGPPSAEQELVQLRQTNRINQVRHSGGKRLSPIQQILDTHRKYNVEPPAALLEAAKQTGTVPAFAQEHDFAYYSPITVGSQQFLIDFDTGSWDFWLFSKELPKSQRGNHTLYNLSGRKFRRKQFVVFYGDGTYAAGNVYTNKVVVGGATATRQAIEAASTVAEKLVKRGQDGFVGLGFSGGNQVTPHRSRTLMDNIGPTLPKNLFTVTLRHNATGSYDFGFIDPSKYVGPIGYTPCDNSSFYWGVHPSGFQIGQEGQVQNQTFYALADTGTSYLFIPHNIVKSYYKKVPGAHYNSTQYGYIYPCTSRLPNLSLFFNGHKATIPGSYITIYPVGDGYCLGGIFSSKGFPFSILGDTFLKSQFAVFDFDGPSLGFAQQPGVPIY